VSKKSVPMGSVFGTNNITNNITDNITDKVKEERISHIKLNEGRLADW
jgi:hypothetical protein